MKDYLRRNGVWIGFLLLVLAMTIATQGGFLSARNLTNLMRQASINGILAGGMTLVILTGGIDLSIGSVVAVCGIIVGLSQVTWGWGALGVSGALGSIAIALGSGLASGLLTGGLIAGLGIAPFVITLGMMVIARGLALIFSNGSAISPMGEELVPIANEFLSTPWTLALVAIVFVTFAWRAYKRSGSERLDMIFPFLIFSLISYSFLMYRGFPTLTVFLMLTLGALGFTLTRTGFGRSVYAIGSNERAAFFAGVPIRRVTVLVYAIMGLLSGLAALLLTARLNGADPNAGQLFELDAIAAVVIGGTSLKGGQGSIMGTFIGALTIAALNNGMDLLGVPSFYQMVFKGLIIVVAVSLDQGQRRRA